MNSGMSPSVGATGKRYEPACSSGYAPGRPGASHSHAPVTARPGASPTRSGRRTDWLGRLAFVRHQPPGFLFVERLAARDLMVVAVEFGRITSFGILPVARVAMRRLVLVKPAAGPLRSFEVPRQRLAGPGRRLVLE